jgi:hypothetical protein
MKGVGRKRWDYMISRSAGRRRGQDPALIAHSDRGNQIASVAFRRELALFGSPVGRLAIDHMCTRPRYLY